MKRYDRSCTSAGFVWVQCGGSGKGVRQGDGSRHSPAQSKTRDAPQGRSSWVEGGGKEIASYRGKSLGWVNREGSIEEEEFKLKSQTEKELPLREQGRCAPR